MFNLRTSLKTANLVIFIIFFFLLLPNPLDVTAQTTPILHGGKESDYAYSVIQTKDGGYAIAGYTTSFGAGGKDCLLVKTTSDGTPEWSITYGSQEDEIAYSVLQTDGEDYLLVGSVTTTQNGLDGLIVQIDKTGKEIKRSQTYGGTEDDEIYQIVESGISYALAGRTSSYGAGGNDFWLIKINSGLEKEMEHWYGGSRNDVAESIVHIGDGKYVIVGYSKSNSVSEDLWCIRTDNAGNMDLDLTLGGPGVDGGRSIIRSNDGGYAIAGYKSFDENDVRDFWLVKINVELDLEYEQIFGEPDQNDGAWSIGQLPEGEYVLAGYTYSNLMKNDIMIVKTRGNGLEDWKKTYGSSGNEGAESLVLPEDDIGIVIAGFTSSYGTNDDFYLLKTWSNGDLQWSQTYGEDIFSSFIVLDYWHFIIFAVAVGLIALIFVLRTKIWQWINSRRAVTILSEDTQFSEFLKKEGKSKVIFNWNKLVLNGKQEQKLAQALIAAYPKRKKLEKMVRYKLDEHLDVIVEDSHLGDVLFDLIKWANSEGRVGELVFGAFEFTPGNPALKTFIQEFIALNKPLMK